jgi:hypothetical protein
VPHADHRLGVLAAAVCIPVTHPEERFEERALLVARSPMRTVIPAIASHDAIVAVRQPQRIGRRMDPALDD